MAQSLLHQIAEQKFQTDFWSYEAMGNGIDASRVAVGSYSVTEIETTWLANDYKWGSGALGTKVTLAYSFIGIGSSFYDGYGRAGVPSNIDIETPDESIVALSAKQKQMIGQALAQISSVSGVTFRVLAESASQAGDIRFGNTASNDVETAQGTPPVGTDAFSGDVWFGNKLNYLAPSPGNYAYAGILHETMHALGFKHPHEGGAPATRDAIKFSVLSYRDFVGDTLTGYSTSYFPTTLMVDDIRALQAVYGANHAVNAGDTVYTWAADKRIFETIWDGGGVDTIDASNQIMGVSISLAAGSFSTIGKSIDLNGFAPGGVARNCLAIAYDCRIEIAKGSAYGDKLTGNIYANILSGNGGNDALKGGRRQGYPDRWRRQGQLRVFFGTECQHECRHDQGFQGGR